MDNSYQDALTDFDQILLNVNNYIVCSKINQTTISSKTNYQKFGGSTKIKIEGPSNRILLLLHSWVWP